MSHLWLLLLTIALCNLENPRRNQNAPIFSVPPPPTRLKTPYIIIFIAIATASSPPKFISLPPSFSFPLSSDEAAIFLLRLSHPSYRLFGSRGKSAQAQVQESRKGPQDKMVMCIIKNVLTTSLRLMEEKVRSEDLKPGDHIYRYGLYGLYSHHGIYVGDGYVIHFTRTESKTITFPLLSKREILPPCPDCEHQKNIKRGVVKTCLDCFQWDGIKHQSLHFYEHRRPLLGYKLTRQEASTMLLYTRLPDQVVDTACKLHANNGFGNYSLINNNCEHFATFCRTGVRASEQTAFLSDCEQKLRKLKNGP